MEKVNNGMHQGSVLGLVLLNAFINYQQGCDLVMEVTESMSSKDLRDFSQRWLGGAGPLAACEGRELWGQWEPPTAPGHCRWQGGPAAPGCRGSQRGSLEFLAIAGTSRDPQSSQLPWAVVGTPAALGSHGNPHSAPPPWEAGCGER